MKSKLFLTFTFSILIFTFSIPTPTHANITTGLVGHWKFDEGSGTTVADSVGSYSGNLVNSPEWTAGKVGSGALVFNGTYKFVQIPTAPTLTSTYTTSFWFYPTELGDNQGLIAHGLAAGNNMIFLTAGNQIQITSHSAGSFRTWCNKTFTASDLNQWHHLTVVINSTTDASQWKCYFDGADIGVINSDSSGTYSNPGNTNWTIGAYYNNSYWFNGKMDEVRIYNRALSAQEALDIYNDLGAATLPAPSPSPSPTPTPTPPPPTPTPPSGNTITAATCSQADVQTAVNTATSGGTVNVPAGNCTWSTFVDVTKAISIIGAGSGIGGTKLTATNALNNGFFNVHDVSSSQLMRISGFYFELLNWTPPWAIKMYLNNSLDDVRIDHNIFNQSGVAQIEIGGSKGVIDHNYFYNGNKAISFTAGSRAQADASWVSMVAGSGDALFIEDNYFIDNASYIGPYGSEKIGTYNGGKLVIRYNNFDATAYPLVHSRDGTILTFTPFMAHGSACGGCSASSYGYWQTTNSNARRGQSLIEIYNNNIAGKRIDFPFTVRGSSNLIFNNTFTISTTWGTNIALVEEEYRAGNNWVPARTAWPAEDQVHNTFIWNNTRNGSQLTSANISVNPDTTKIQQDRDYFLHAPQATGGKETFICVTGVTQCNGSSSSYPTDGNTYPTKGTMTFSASGPNAYYPYTPYTYPHPLVTGQTPPPVTSSPPTPPSQVPPQTPTPTPSSQPVSVPTVTPPSSPTLPTYTQPTITPPISTLPNALGVETTAEDPEITRLRNILATLLKQVADLQAQLLAKQGGNTTKLNLTRTLYIGTKGTDVTNLQTFLITKGYLTQGNATGYFGNLTRQAVQKYQCDKLGICSGSPTTNGYGVVGPKTRGEIGK